MKTTLFASVSVNGKVLMAENPNHQVPAEVLGDFMQKVVTAGNVVMGNSTFRMLAQHPATLQALSGVELVVLSSNGAEMEGCKVVASPAEAIAYLQQKGCTEVLVGGGSHTYRSFLEAGIITGLHLNLVPVIAAAGGDWWPADADWFQRLQLISEQRMVGDVVQVHYETMSLI